MCPNCEKKDKKIYELSLRLGIKKRQFEILEEELEKVKLQLWAFRNVKEHDKKIFVPFFNPPTT